MTKAASEGDHADRAVTVRISPDATSPSIASTSSGEPGHQVAQPAVVQEVSGSFCTWPKTLLRRPEQKR